MNDLKFAFRQLRKSPGFSSLAIVTLALGIGVNSAIFALINGLLLQSGRGNASRMKSDNKHRASNF